jgi:hypothetical protein
MGLHFELLDMDVIYHLCEMLTEQRRCSRAGIALPEAETQIANRRATKALFKLRQDLRFGDALEFVMKSWLQDANVEHAFAQRSRRGVRGDKIADDGTPGADDFGLAQALFEAEFVHERRQELSCFFATIARSNRLWKSTPFPKNGGPKRGVHIVILNEVKNLSTVNSRL